MNIQILISTINQTDYSLLERMGVECDAVVVNQCGRDELREFNYKEHHITWINMSKYGVGLSRSIALYFSRADIVLFADDDVTYNIGYSSAVLSAFESLPKCDVICFNVNLINSNKNIGANRRNNKIKKLHIWNSLRYGACRIAARSKVLKRERLSFSLLFGGGAEFSSGEDSLFIADCHRRGLTLYSHPYELGDVDDSVSSWYSGVSTKLLEDRGMIYRLIFPRIYFFVSLYYSIRHTHFCQFSLLQRLSCYLRGARKARLYR